MLRQQLLKLFFLRAPSGILESDIAAVYIKTFQTALCFMDESLSEFIDRHLNEYIDECDTSERKRLYFFRSNSEFEDPITRVLMSLDLDIRKEWIRDKIKIILSLYKSGIEWRNLIVAIQSFGPFDLTPSLLGKQQMPPRFLIQSLQHLVPDMDVEWRDDTESSLCILQKPKKAVDIDTYRYDLLILDTLRKTKTTQRDDDKGLFIEEIETAFNKVTKQMMPIIIETPTILTQIRPAMDAKVYDEYKRFKIKDNPYPHEVGRNEYQSTAVNQQREKPKIEEYQTQSSIIRTPHSSLDYSSSSSASPPPGGDPEDLHPGDLCQVHGVSTNLSLNGVNVKLMEYNETTTTWTVFITTGRLAGDTKRILRINLRKMESDASYDRYTTPRQQNEESLRYMNMIKEQNTTKFGVINLSKNTSRKRMLTKMQKTFGVEVLYCSDVVQNPYDAKSNFIAKIEVASPHQTSLLLQAMRRGQIELHPYRYKSDYEPILGYIINVVTERSKGKRNISISGLYRAYKQKEFNQVPKVTLIEFCQIIEHRRSVLVMKDNMVQLVP